MLAKLVESGLLRYALVELLWKSRLMRWLLLMLFNFKIGKKA